jgi:hypothetical protein
MIWGFQDSEDVQQPPDFITYFETAPNLFAWREPRPQQIEHRRAALNDTLIFDILLSSGGITQPDTFYPPSDIPSLQRLLNAIIGSTYDALKKECLVYFLLKWHQDGRESLFQYERCIPPQFATLADAYWHLDSGINVAVRLWLKSFALYLNWLLHCTCCSIPMLAACSVHPLRRAVK